MPLQVLARTAEDALRGGYPNQHHGGDGVHHLPAGAQAQRGRPQGMIHNETIETEAGTHQSCPRLTALVGLFLLCITHVWLPGYG